MAADMTKKELWDTCHHIGLHVDYYSPGDGVTRYRFWNRGILARSAEELDYFSCNGIYTALGLAEACTFVAGYQHGRASARVDWFPWDVK